MKFKVIHAKRYSTKYLRHVSRLVYELIRSSTITQRYPEEKVYFVGPDGIRFCLEEKGGGDPNPVVNVIEDGLGLVRLCIPKYETLEPFESFRIPPWLEPACDYSCFNAALHFFAPLMFGQITLGDASKLFNVPSDFLEENFLKEQHDREDSVALLPLSVTRGALTPDETYIDIRGLIAWLIINEHVHQYGYSCF